MREYLTVADLLAMPHLGLQLAAGSEGAGNSVLWTHISELEDPGPWLEGGELLIVNGFGIPDDAAGQVGYVARLAQHRLAGIAISVRAPVLTKEMLAEADRLRFPVLRIPRQVPFIELSYLIANASEQSARGRLARHLRIFETLRLRNSLESDTAEIYAQLEQVSGYRLALVTPAGHPLLPAWRWVPKDLDLDLVLRGNELRVVPGGYVLPLLVGSRVTAYLIGVETPEVAPGGLAALQHVSTLAALDAIDDQRRREALHREGSALLARALDADGDAKQLNAEFAQAGLRLKQGVRLLSIEAAADGELDEIEVRDWLADRSLPHLLLTQGELCAVVDCGDDELRELAVHADVHIGVSTRVHGLADLGRGSRQARWSLNTARASRMPDVAFTEQQLGLAQWLNQDIESVRQLATGTLHPLIQHDAAHGTELLRTLRAYFLNQGRLRSTAAQLYVHEHTLSYRLKRIEQLTGRDLKRYQDTFELWLAVESSFLAGSE